MNDLARVDEAESKELEFFQPANIFDVERFEQVHRVANVMASASLVPDHIKGASPEETYANCFMIANMAANWQLDPFSVAQASSIVYGKLVLEGKLIRSVIRKFLGFDLHYRKFGNSGDKDRGVYICDRPLVDGDGEPLSADAIEDLMENNANWRITKGTFAKWHTKDKQGNVKDNWAKDEPKMFRERGAREWCREFAPGLMLGVYTPDEFDDADLTARSNRARDISPRPTSNPLLEDGGQQPMEKIDPSTGEVTETTGAQRAQPAYTTAAASEGDKPAASAKPSSRDDGGAGASSAQESRPQEQSSPSSDGSEQRNSTPQVGGSSPSESASSSEDSRSSSPAAGDGSGGDSASSPPIPRSTFMKYAKTICRYKSADNVKKGSKKFFTDEGITGGTETEKKLFVTLRDKFIELVIDGGVSVEDFLRNAEGWIAADVPEGDL